MYTVSLTVAIKFCMIFLLSEDSWVVALFATQLVDTISMVMHIACVQAYCVEVSERSERERGRMLARRAAQAKRARERDVLVRRASARDGGCWNASEAITREGGCWRAARA